MKNKKGIINLIIVVLIAIIVGFGIIKCYNYQSNKIRGKGTPRLEKTSEVVIVIEKNKKCTPVSLSLYVDGTYELFTDYEACRPFQECTLRLHYTKSIKGTYNYDITKILDKSINEDYSTLDDKQIDYKIYTSVSGSSFVLDEKYNHDYVTKKGETNDSLDAFLKEIGVDLDICAIPEYN